MVESFKEIMETSKAKKAEEMDTILREHLNVGFSECVDSLSVALKERAEELLEDLPNVSPYGDYEKLMEDPEKILSFLKEEASKPENWKIHYLEVRKEKDQLMELVFFNQAVDDGDILKGFVFIGLSGKIRHSFTQIHS